MKTFNTEAFIKKYVTGREESLFKKDIEFNREALQKEINGKSVLVIGGAGTIGSSFIKAILHFYPKRLYVVDINENGLTELTRDLRSSTNLNVPEEYKTYPINFGDAVFEKLLSNEGPFEIVANFAAHKHVRSEKDHYSIEAMIDNNVLKAKRLLDLLTKYPPEHFFCVSTDKAANPVSVMGASKKLMEEVIMAYSEKIPITTARFANVAFSNGSLLFGFLERLMKHQPLSVPTDIRRYFVSPEESGQLCMLACMMGKSGEIFFPKMAETEMKTFASITYDFLKEYGLETDACHSEDEARKKAKKLHNHSKSYPVFFFKTDTSGEKSYEEFFTEQDKVSLERFAELGVIENATKKSLKLIEQRFEELNKLFSNNDVTKKNVVEWLSGVVEGFHHIETGKSLDQKM
jgi:FlaA1/EpsC-like NDP-sugar epimerase